MTVQHGSARVISPDELAADFDSALLAVMARAGDDLALPKVSWSAVAYPDGLVVEGHLSALEPASIATCEAWASALGMSEYSWLGDNGQRSWHLERGAWTIELSCD